MKQIIIFILLLLFCCACSSKKLPNLENWKLEEVQNYCEKYKLVLKIEEEYHETIEKGEVINQSISPGSSFSTGQTLVIMVSLGRNLEDIYKQYSVNELGNVPIMMYHGIENVENKYIGGNIDKDGYHRTSVAFRKDLEFYYQNGYRMMRLMDYVEGNIEVELGKSPIILTFDDGLESNFKVLGEDEEGNLIIDPNSAIGILEEFKQKYPDYGVTATFFLNGGLFRQSDYNEKILKWLIKQGYDIGNHTSTHADLTSITKEQVEKEVGSMYQQLDKIIGTSYVPIIALPFGLPYQQEHGNFSSILVGNYQGTSYHTKTTLRVGWESELSPFHKKFSKTYLKRIRAYDNNGQDFDITYNFKQLETNRYISDGDKNTIVTSIDSKDDIDVNTSLQIITYE